MPWNFETDQFESPNHVTVPMGFLCRNAISLFLTEQVRLFTWWNNTWSDLMFCELKNIVESQCFIGLPTSANTRGLYFFPICERQTKDNFKQDKIGFGVFYLTGKTQATGVEAYKYNDLNESTYYLDALYSLFDTAPLQQKLFKDFPSIEGAQTPVIRAFTATILNPDGRNPALENIGVQAYLQLEFTVFPSIVYLP